MTHPLIELYYLSKVYQQDEIGIEALAGCSLIVEEGEFTALVGPSGSGKTTLLNMVGGLDKPTAGTVHLEGNPIELLSPAALADFRRDHFGFVFQSYNLIPVLTARENIEFVMLLQGVADAERGERVSNIMDEVGLSGMEDRMPAQLSGGQQQRVAVARAMVARPRIILADEPTANLDSKTGRDLLEMMQRLNKEQGMTFLFSTHDPMIMEFATRIVRLQDGLIIADERKE